jgi:hypothetical protein
MKKMYFSVPALFLLPFLMLSPARAAEELDIVNRPVNTSGLTGLLFTTSPYTLTPGAIEFGASVLSENSVVPDFTITEYPVSITVGMTPDSEIALRGSYFNIKEGPTGTTAIERKTGDVELSYKWNFLPQPEDSRRPTAALIVTGVVPADNNSDRRISSISHWGLRVGLSAGAEIIWKDHILGIYADGQVAGQDLTESRLKDLYGIINAGLLFPVSKRQNLQMFIEYSMVSRKDNNSLSGGDYTALTYGLRLVSAQFNLTFGTQFLRKKVEGYDNSGRVIGLMSFKF